MQLSLFAGLRPFSRSGAVRDALAGVTLASMNIPQVLGYTRIAGTPVVTGLYTVLLPLVAFAVFGSPRHLVVAATRPRRPSSSVRCPKWRRLPARSTWRWLAWSRCSRPGSCFRRGSSSWGSYPISSRAQYWSGFSLVSGFRSGSRCSATCSVSRSVRTTRSLRRGKSYRACRGPIFRHWRRPHLW
jgi:hypothetical protein